MRKAFIWHSNWTWFQKVLYAIVEAQLVKKPSKVFVTSAIYWQIIVIIENIAAFELFEWKRSRNKRFARRRGRLLSRFDRRDNAFYRILNLIEMGKSSNPMHSVCNERDYHFGLINGIMSLKWFKVILNGKKINEHKASCLTS